MSARIRILSLPLLLACETAPGAETTLPPAMPWAAAGLLGAALAGLAWWLAARRRRRAPPWLRDRRWAARQPPARHCTRRPPLLGGLALATASGLSLAASLLDLHPAAGAALAITGAVAALLGTGVVVHGLLRLHPDVTACRLVTLPGVPGGWFKAVVRLPAVTGATQMTVRLVNGRYGEAGSPTAFRPLWSAAVSTPFAALTSLPDGRRELPVRFRLPAAGVLPSGDDGDGRVAWSLETAVETAAVVLRTRFHVPVFAVDTPAAAEQADAGLPGEPEWQPANDETPPPPGVSLLPTRGRLALHFDARHPRRTTLLAGFALLMLGAAAGLAGHNLPAAIIAAATAVAGGYRAVGVFAERWRVKVAADGDLSVHHGLLLRSGLFVPARAICEVRLDFERGRRADAPARSYTACVVYEQDGRQVALPVSPALCSIEEAEWIRRRIEASLKHHQKDETLAAGPLV